MNNTQVKAIRDFWADVTEGVSPGQLSNAARATLAELHAAEERRRKAWEMTEMVDVPGLGRVTIAAMRWAFDQVGDKGYWKRSIMARIHGRLLLITAAAIEFYHGEAPQAAVDATGTSYCWPFVTVDRLPMVRVHRDYWIRSQGYAC